MLKTLTATLIALVNRSAPARAAEYRSALADVDIKAAEAAVDALEAQRQTLLVKGDDAGVDRLDMDIRAANREVEKLYATQKELTRLLTEAEASEKSAQTDDLNQGIKTAIANLHRAVAAKAPDGIAAQLEELQRRIDAAEAFGLGDQHDARGARLIGVQALTMHKYVELDAVAMRTSELLEEISKGHAEIVRSNKAMRQDGRDDLTVAHPMNLLASHLGHTRSSSPINFNEWSLSGYATPESRERRILGKMADVINDLHGKAP